MMANEATVGLEPEPSTSSSSSYTPMEETAGEEDEDVCRICRTSGDAENPLYYPCACSGSIKYVHQDCLLQWLNHSNARQCEVCKHAFSFSPVYAENAPARLPFTEVLVGTSMKALRGLHFFFRLSFVLSVWLLLIPFVTFWFWRLSFVRSFMEARKLFLSRVSTNHIYPALFLTDCLHGFLLSAGIVFIFLGATSMREYFRHLREIERQNPEREDDVVHRQNGERAGRRLLIRDVAHVGGNGEGGGAGQENVGGGQAIRRNGQNVAAAHLEMQAARFEANVEQIFDGGDDADGVEDVPFDELVGMQGPVFHLLENAITVLASNMIFLGVVIFLPFHLGRIVLSVASQLVVTTSSALLTAGISSTTESALGLVNATLQNGFDSVSNMSAAGLVKDSIAENMTAMVFQGDGSSSVITSGVTFDLLPEALLVSLRHSDVGTLSIGYVSILFLVFGYLGFIALIRYSRGEPLTVGRIYGIASVAEAAPSLARQFLAGVKYFFTMVKVAFLLLVEIGIFPLLCGWWLDVCTISMLGTSLSQRVTFFWASPITSSLIHWLVGIVYMLQISIFVSLLREVLRPGVLYFLRDPADPNYNPFRDLIDDPIHKHARRVLLSVVVYGSLIVLLVFLPVNLAMHLAPSMFPLDTSVSDPFTEIPADMLLFSICIPFAIEHFRPRATFKTVLFHWFSAVSWMLGLSDFLLPNPEDRDGRANANAEQGVQGRLQEIHYNGIQEQNRHRLAVPAAGNVGRTFHENEGVASEENDGDDEEDSEECKFAIRIVLLLLGAWLTLLCLNSAMVVVPISLGRALFAYIPRFPITHGIKCNDLYAFNIGCYTIWAAAAAVGYAIDYLREYNFKVLFMNLMKWSIIVLKSCILLSLWIIVIPVFIGLLFELLVIVPLRVPVDESPVFLLYQDWALGLIFLKIWTKLVLLGQMAPLADDSWRVKFEQVKADGFSDLRGLWVLREIVAPILIKLLTALSLPYVFARGVFPLFGYSLIVNSAVYRFAWSGCLILGLLWYWMRRFQQWFMDLHNSIRDDRYLIGRRLHNFREELENARLRESNNNSSQAVGDLPTDESSEEVKHGNFAPQSSEHDQSFSSGSSSRHMEMGNLRHRISSTSG
uniref:RING-type E3 ubiquitin transferase n=1 Tax=Araucaria cunninghamii TaxID=56994 RepID=A0A0D6QUN6_ARACU